MGGSKGEGSSVTTLPASTEQCWNVWYDFFWPARIRQPFPIIQRFTSPDTNLLEAAIGEVVRRHDVLRTTFKIVGGMLYQVVAETGSFRLPVLDVRDNESSAISGKAVRWLS